MTRNDDETLLGRLTPAEAEVARERLKEAFDHLLAPRQRRRAEAGAGAGFKRLVDMVKATFIEVMTPAGGHWTVGDPGVVGLMGGAVVAETAAGLGELCPGTTLQLSVLAPDRGRYAVCLESNEETRELAELHLDSATLGEFPVRVEATWPERGTLVVLAKDLTRREDAPLEQARYDFVLRSA